MPQDFIFSSEQLAAIERDGVLRLPGLIPREKASKARQAVQRRLAELGLWDGTSAPSRRPKPRWPQTGLQPGRDLTTARPEVAALFEDPAVAGVIGAALDRRTIDCSIHPRPQLLVSLPNCEEWETPRGWHTDSPRLASGESPGVQLFLFLDRVEARGGGTLVVAGSHRLLNDRGDLKPGDVNRLLRAEPSLRGLFKGGVLAGEQPVRLVELTGEPGDAWLADLRVLHSAAPNATDRPRMMATHRYHPEDLLPQIKAAFRWS
ncbi:MAG: phytanoyl-CoA dioxygenase family protein [Caulobacteraceae bacterium]|nr:phytanoyl-CoA dioxygenase family protein [Caulobacteraceae bacterium]